MISELAFARNGRIEPHANPNTTWFIVIEGGGWVIVDGEPLRVAAGEAVLWPPDVPHGAWADHGHMRAFVVELAGPDDHAFRGILEGHAIPALGSGIRTVSRGDGTASGHEYRLPDEPDAGEPH